MPLSSAWDGQAEVVSSTLRRKYRHISTSSPNRDSTDDLGAPGTLIPRVFHKVLQSLPIHRCMDTAPERKAPAPGHITSETQAGGNTCLPVMPWGTAR